MPGRNKPPVCDACGDLRLAGEVWFLIAEDDWSDKLRILRWDDGLAASANLRRACCPFHVQELVVQWIATGSLPEAVAATDTPQPLELDSCGARQIGELSVHRESVKRVLLETPGSLKVVLVALLEALERETPGFCGAVEEDEAHPVAPM